MLAILRIALLSLAVSLPNVAAWADQFTPEQRAEIVQILRDALKQDPSILRDAVAALQADESDRQKASLAAVKDKLVDPGDPVGGNPKGDVTIVEFFDVRCPYCRKLEPSMAELLARDRSIRLVYKDMPILGPASILGSKALLAAHKQGGYEKLRDAVMAGPPQLTKAQMQDMAQKAGLDWKRLERDMDDPAIQARIDANLKLARSLGIEGTPALIIGDEIIPGAVTTAELTKAVAAVRARR